MRLENKPFIIAALSHSVNLLTPGTGFFRHSDQNEQVEAETWMPGEGLPAYWNPSFLLFAFFMGFWQCPKHVSTTLLSLCNSRPEGFLGGA